MSLEHVRHFDGAYADFWRERAREYGHREGHQRAIALAASKVPPGGLLLDCGMGNGFPFTIAWSRSLRVAGCDLSARMLAEARPSLEGGAGARLAAGDLGALPFRDACAEVVVCARAIHYVPDIPGAVRELWRVVRPGGTLLFDAYTRVPSPSILRRMAQMKDRRWWTGRPIPGDAAAADLSSLLAWLGGQGGRCRIYDDEANPLPVPEGWRGHRTVWIVTEKPR